MASTREFSLKDIEGHNTKSDLWVAIHGKVYDITKYIQDHPGGQDLLIDVGGTDATGAFEDVGHSEDASEILEQYLIGTLKDSQEVVRPKAVRVIPQSAPLPTTKSSMLGNIAIITSLGGLASLLFFSRSYIDLPDKLARLPKVWLKDLPEIQLPRGGFSNGFISATALCAAAGGMIGVQLSKVLHIEAGFERYPPHVKSRKIAKLNPNLARGFLEPKEYKSLPLIKKDKLSPNVFRFVFQLPNPTDVIGIPIGQHVAIKATINGAAVSRSYTPTSNNTDLGKLELVIKCYPDGVLTGQYLANLEVGDKVLFRGPKGAMKYHSGLCKQIGMIAGGTGITPMYQLIRAICEDETDLTQVSLIYANRSEEDILLRKELEFFARHYPRNFKIWYMLDNPPQKWAYGKGFVTADVMAAKLPKPSMDTKIMLCGPPGMVNASKKALINMGFQAPGSVSKMSDQIFCF
ncbi:hypothetical protein DTO166G4_3217 [Paecilomyces variotii]|nr:hypothetical protein DTO164E3_7875 [Paecilomyces variotii]KAJ9194643.1 hypothetical protein DTO032I3_7258 [Paecilomyces variotii]KAJ9215139.1 hypothetical protein DTO166G4_3217 [Paecilomyces variotii]KAJ9220857.1 hypothetical protein DTO169C6_6802 [Paecilomyces variotii]KAJ9231279.1 hypothetical protein DTO169E5_8034 [Paecilomyces variotii]